MAENLKPCPFCGGPATIRKSVIEGKVVGYVLVHENYDCICDTRYMNQPICNTPEDVIEKWNRRAEPQSDESNLESYDVFQDFPDWFNEYMGGWDKW